MRNFWNIDLVAALVDKAGYTLVSKEYKNSSTKLELTCPKGHTCKIAWDEFNGRGIRCGSITCKTERSKATNMARRGVENVAQDPSVQEQIAETNMEKRGVKCSLQDPIVRAKANEKIWENWGVDNISQHPEIKEQTKRTNMDRYGAPYPMQNPEIMEKQQKSAHSRKPYTFKSGRTEFVQGYEPFGLDYLINNGIPEEEIVVGFGNVPSIDYINKNSRGAMYFPDIYLPMRNAIIEVKCPYTLERELEKNLLKFKATVQAGYKFVCICFQ